MAILAGMFNKWADDDKEDYTTQYAAYQANRILLEMKAFMSFQEFTEMMKEPVVAANAIQELSEITTAFAFSEDDEIERGMYKGWHRGGKWWLRRTPVKSLYELGVIDLGSEEDAPAGARIKSKNKFIKSVVESSTYDWLFKDKDDNFVDRLFGYSK